MTSGPARCRAVRVTRRAGCRRQRRCRWPAGGRPGRGRAAGRQRPCRCRARDRLGPGRRVRAGGCSRRRRAPSGPQRAPARARAPKARAGAAARVRRAAGRRAAAAVRLRAGRRCRRRATGLRVTGSTAGVRPGGMRAPTRAPAASPASQAASRSAATSSSPASTLISSRTSIACTAMPAIPVAARMSRGPARPSLAIRVNRRAAGRASQNVGREGAQGHGEPCPCV